MALAAATITALTNRWTLNDLAQMSAADDFDATTPTIDEDRLERAVIQAQAWVQQRKGAVDENDPLVIEATPIFLVRLDMRQQYLDAWEQLYGNLTVPYGATVTTAKAATSDESRRRYGGGNYWSDTTTSASPAVRRGTRQ